MEHYDESKQMDCRGFLSGGGPGPASLVLSGAADTRFHSVLKVVIILTVGIHLKIALAYAGLPVEIPAAEGPVSWFGGPGDVREWGPIGDRDRGIGENERDWRNEFFLKDLGEPHGPNGGDPYYIAMRWFNPNRPPRAFGALEVWNIKNWYAQQRVAVVCMERRRMVVCWIADWGPARGRIYEADVGPGVLKKLGILSGDQVRFGWSTEGAATGLYLLHRGVWIQDPGELENEER